jgi:uncharacterized transporter YbjL
MSNEDKIDKVSFRLGFIAGIFLMGLIICIIGRFLWG